MADPENFCAMNLALYGPGGGWAMTERGRKNLRRDAKNLQIGPSGLAWDGNALIAEIDEITVPLPRRLRGTIKLFPQALQAKTFVLDANGRHVWRPIAPAGRVEVAFKNPALRWQGHAYLDSNTGAAPLAEDFSAWHWSRAANGGAVFYDAARRDGTELALALHTNRHGEATEFVPPKMQDLPKTFWRVERKTRGASPSVLQTFEDAPFYARSKIVSNLDGKPVESIHESLNLNRFVVGTTQFMLPFRMPRRG